MGYAIHLFNDCESTFVYLYAAMANPLPTDDVLARSFGSIISTTTKRQVIQEAADSFFRYHPNNDLKKQVNRLLVLFKDAASRRNEIAHGYVCSLRRTKVVNKKHVPLPDEWFLVPTETASNKRGPLSFATMGDMKYRYNSREIEKFATNLEALRNFAEQVRVLLRQFQKTLHQENT